MNIFDRFMAKHLGKESNRIASGNLTVATTNDDAPQVLQALTYGCVIRKAGLDHHVSLAYINYGQVVELLQVSKQQKQAGTTARSKLFRLRLTWVVSLSTVVRTC